MTDKFEGFNKEARFFDKEDHYDPLIYEKIPNVSSDFGIQIRKIIPKEGEVRLLGNRHRDCLYYSMGLDICRNKIVMDDRPSFIGCKKVLDSMFQCYTNYSDVEEYHNIREVAKPYMNQFMSCLFKKESNFDNCMMHFENSVRAIYRDKEHGLIDYY